MRCRILFETAAPRSSLYFDLQGGGIDWKDDRVGGKGSVFAARGWVRPPGASNEMEISERSSSSLSEIEKGRRNLKRRGNN
ncbi:hypothetical protein CDAR_34731 [Caerostris darwini]|uniref:Uncharacterized protein n=1 Tax=Caerostris darwini TaxID=1538125 RepID=A0AAV4RXD2_9ARAC|nr:hypothetical protein CDAR_34731 [Caerostris darwini]